MIVSKPPMGVNTWNTFGLNISEDLVIGLVDEIVAKGLKEVGFEYIVLDDGWQAKTRTIEGTLREDKDKFPNGLKFLSDYIHKKGLKFGLYSCAGCMTCGGFPGSYGYEFEDAEFFASVGCDYLKYDYCYMPNLSAGNRIYHKMGMALRACGREIVFSACNWGKDDVFSWIRSSGANMYRSTFDIFDNYKSFTGIAASQLDKLNSSGFNCFNDMDMLTVGMYGNGYVGKGGCTFEEYKTQYSLWCMYGAPLIIGCDVRKLNEESLTLLKNKNLIAIDQDEECRPPYPIGLGVNNEKETNVLFRFLSNGIYALAVYNFEDEQKQQIVVFAETGIAAAKGYSWELVDAFEESEEERHKDYFKVDVPAHGVKMYLCRLVKD